MLILCFRIQLAKENRKIPQCPVRFDAMTAERRRGRRWPWTIGGLAIDLGLTWLVGYPRGWVLGSGVFLLGAVSVLLCLPVVVMLWLYRHRTRATRSARVGRPPMARMVHHLRSVAFKT
jgi:hypothetical protein